MKRNVAFPHKSHRRRDCGTEIRNSRLNHRLRHESCAEAPSPPSRPPLNAYHPDKDSLERVSLDNPHLPGRIILFTRTRSGSARLFTSRLASSVPRNRGGQCVQRFCSFSPRLWWAVVDSLLLPWCFESLTLPRCDPVRTVAAGWPHGAVLHLYYSMSESSSCSNSDIGSIYRAYWYSTGTTAM